MKIYNTKIDQYLNQILISIFIVSICFPYIQIIPLVSYNQPYSLIIGILIIVINNKLALKIAKRKLFISLIYLFILSIILYILTCYPYNNKIDLKYLITYLTLPIVSIATFIALNLEKSKIVKILIYSSLTWLLIGLFQQFVTPSFLSFLVGQWNEVAEDSILSGRGVTNLAPEPTHYGFHILLMATTLNYFKNQLLFVIICVLQCILLARSSSGFLTIILGVLFLFLFSKSSLKKYIIIFFTFTITIFIYKYIINLDQDSIDFRILSLLQAFLESPMDLLKVDASLNARLGGVYYSFQIIVKDFFMPHGLSQLTWLKYNYHILSSSNWLFMLSESQPPSGIGTILYQCGFLSLYPIFKIISVILKSKSVILTDWLKYTTILVVISQFSLATPIFCFIIGLAEYNTNFNKNVYS